MIPKHLRVMHACQDNVEPKHLAGLLRIHKVLWGTPKKDGIRCRLFRPKQPFGRQGELQGFSRKHIRIPNAQVQMWISEARNLYENMDGELIVVGGSFNDTQSKIMTRISAPFEWIYHVFDVVIPERPNATYLQRLQKMQERYKWNAKTRMLLPVRLDTVDAILAYEKEQVDAGEEGIILRAGDAPYKFGRSTWDEGFMLKMKRWEDREARIIGFVEKRTNKNELKKDAQGFAKRSKHKDNMVRAGTLGAILGEDLETKVQFEVGSGWDAAWGLWAWHHRADILDEVFTYKKAVFGEKNKPRQPIFKGMRND